MQSNKLTFSVVVRDSNSWDAKTGIHLQLAECGHNHKSLATAQRCYSKLAGQQADGMYSARWYHARIEDSEGDTYDNYGDKV
jgi:hypothetical protein